MFYRDNHFEIDICRPQNEIKSGYNKQSLWIHYWLTRLLIDFVMKYSNDWRRILQTWKSSINEAWPPNVTALPDLKLPNSYFTASNRTIICCIDVTHIADTIFRPLLARIERIEGCRTWFEIKLVRLSALGRLKRQWIPRIRYLHQSETMLNYSTGVCNDMKLPWYDCKSPNRDKTTVCKFEMSKS